MAASEDSHSAPESEHPRKKLRKGTHSCWECKRRKVRCQPGPPTGDQCAGCAARGTKCVSQEYPDERSVSGSAGPNGANAPVDNRLKRVEALLEKLVQDPASSHQPSLGPSGPDSAISPYPTTETLSPDGAPIMSLFENSVLGSTENERQQAEEKSTKVNSSQVRAGIKLSATMDKLRRSLAILLPSQEDADTITSSTHSWALAQVFGNPTEELFQDKDPYTSFKMSAVAKQHPVVIARTLIYYSLCIQQLPQAFDSSRLEVNTSLEVLVSEYISTVTDLVTCRDEIISSVEGLECLVMLSMFYINDGNLRRAWLTNRRALNIAQLMGLDRCWSASPRLNATTLEVWRRIWDSIIQSDRYLGFHIGKPPGVGRKCFGLAGSRYDRSAPLHVIFLRKFCLILGDFMDMDRNELGSTVSYSSTLNIDECLDNLKRQMPPSWWAIPEIRENDRSVEAAEAFNRILLQIWYFEVMALLNVPFMLRASEDSRFEFSKASCLTASREILARYVALRNAHNTKAHCKVADFASFVAAVMIILNLLLTQPYNIDPTHAEPENPDVTLIEETADHMEKLASGPREMIASQSSKAVKVLLDMYRHRACPTAKKSLQLNVPYFGKINIHRKPPQSSNFPCKAPVNPSNIAPLSSPSTHAPNDPTGWENMEFNPDIPYVPTISFESAQFPWLPYEKDYMGDFTALPGDQVFWDNILSENFEEGWGMAAETQGGM